MRDVSQLSGSLTNERLNMRPKRRSKPKPDSEPAPNLIPVTQAMWMMWLPDWRRVNCASNRLEGA